MTSESMNSRERWQAVLNGEKPDRVPMDYWGTREASEKLVQHLQCGDISEALSYLHVDRPYRVGPRYVGPACNGTDVFGCRFVEVEYPTGVYKECIHHPLADYDSVEEIENSYTWPDPDWWDYSDIPKQLQGHEDKPVLGGGSEPFLIYTRLRGHEQVYMDLALNPDMTHHCLDKLFDLAYKNTERIYDRIPGKVLISYVAEDLGSQEALLFSPSHIREFLLPRMRRMIQLAHGAGAFVFTHSDGAIREMIPELIDIGVDVLNPVQWRCKGMEREGLKRDYGKDLTFHGAVDNQHTLAFGTVEDVRQEVKDNLQILGNGGGYILAPCHNIQAVGPAENVVTMYETCYRHGWF